jgi:uncharacterized protein DUF6622
MEVDMLLQILKHTPFLVWGILALILYLGYVQSRPHTLARRRIAILPAIFIGVSAVAVLATFGATAPAVIGWVVGLALALLLNRRLRLPRVVHYDAAAARFSLPGSIGPLALMMAIFTTRYVVTVALTIAPALTGSPLFALTVCLVYGGLSGAFLARALRILGAATRSHSGTFGIAASAAA